MPSYDERARAGYDWLTERGIDVAPQVDLDKLDMTLSCTCVLGQLSPDLAQWIDVLYEFGLSQQTAVALGFDAGDSSFAEYDGLREAWVRLLSKVG